MSFDSLDDGSSMVDKELKEFIMVEQKKAQFQNQVLIYTSEKQFNLNSN